MNGLARKLAGLEINVAQQDDGKVAVYTTSEPFFCFVRDTEADALKLVRETLTSYIEHFHEKAGRVTIAIEEATPVRQVHLQSSRRVRPSFAYSSNGENFAFA